MPLTAPTITPTVIIPPYEETVVKPVRLRVGAEVQRFGYAMELLTTASLRVRAGIAITDPADIDVAAITYSQSSVYVDNTAATNAGMTNGSFNTGTQTGTNNESPAWVRMDFGSIKPVADVIIGCDFDEVIPGDWDKTYTEASDVEISDDGSSWTLLFNTGTLSAGITTFPVTALGRYIRIQRNGYLCVTEFYATSG
jgi:hypothetical protein